MNYGPMAPPTQVNPAPRAEDTLNDYQMRGPQFSETTSPTSLWENSPLSGMMSGIMSGIFNTGGGQQNPVNLQGVPRPAAPPQQAAPAMAEPADGAMWGTTSTGDIVQLGEAGNGGFQYDGNWYGEHQRAGDSDDNPYYGAPTEVGSASGHYGTAGGPNITTFDAAQNTARNNSLAIEYLKSQQGGGGAPSGGGPGGLMSQAPPGAAAETPVPIQPSGGIMGAAPPAMVGIPEGQVERRDPAPVGGPENAWGMLDLSGTRNQDFIDRNLAGWDDMTAARRGGY